MLASLACSRDCEFLHTKVNAVVYRGKVAKDWGIRGGSRCNNRGISGV